MSRLLHAVAAAALLVVLAGCGGGEPLEQPAVPALLDDTPSAASGGSEAARVVVVTHGQASDPFWAVVRRGVADAGRQVDLAVSYRSPDSYDVEQMSRLIDAAVATRPAGLVVSLPDPAGLAGAVERALAAGVPVISINSGGSAFRSLGIAVHVGQAEYEAGVGVGERLAKKDVTRALCVVHEAGNQALHERCRGVADTLRRAGGTVTVLTVDLQDRRGADTLIAAALAGRDYDAIVTLGGASIAEPALRAIRARQLDGEIVYATFGVGPDVLRALMQGRLEFAVDQQAYLQGYLPIVLLAQHRDNGILPPQGTLIPTGPVFVTKANASAVLELVDRGLR